MMRKRTRTTKTRTSKKIYESDESDSDVDLDLDSPASSPAPKRYGLRQRKQPVFFDYEDDEDYSSQRQVSEDEEYNVEVDLHSDVINQQLRESKKQDKIISPRETTSIYVADVQHDEIPIENGLIDFEDIIRADVVNKQGVVYDNMITKTEIQVQVSPDPPSPVGEKGKKGKEPKVRPELIEHDNIIKLEPIEEHNPVKISLEDSTNLEVQIDPSNLVQSNLEEDDTIIKVNGHSSQGDQREGKSQKAGNEPKLEKYWAVKIEKYVPPELDEKEKEVMLSNEYLLANTFDVSADEFLKKQEEKKDIVEEEEEDIYDSELQDCHLKLSSTRRPVDWDKIIPRRWLIGHPQLEITKNQSSTN